MLAVISCIAAVGQQLPQSASNQSQSITSSVNYQPQSIVTVPLKPTTAIPANWQPIKVNIQTFSMQSSIQLSQLDDYSDQLSKMYENVVINFTELDKYALKYKYKNRALYEAGNNTIFSQVENPFARNTQF
ncbi:hypothetical protein NMS_1572 [Nonlabens marinus S1-08]|uniref:Uncharacterized protein n=1 Tax=Nonlabens marinus S1-08 TaxID=1454201 RepID=W8W024_9FLAO|nr:hypothetical protein NMS_1572 [Nonlabens marinus S1-08]